MGTSDSPPMVTKTVQEAPKEQLHDLLRKAEKGHTVHGTLLADASNAHLPLHLKDVNILDWEVLGVLIDTEIPEESETFRQLARWFTDEEFLLQKAASFTGRNSKGEARGLSTKDIDILITNQKIQAVPDHQVNLLLA